MFERLELIIGKENLSKLNNTRVLVIGLGGVGGILTETLVRNGIKNITIIDNDIVDITNKNRQIIAMDSTVGKKKTEVMKERLLDINKDCNVTIISEFIDKNNIDLLFKEPIDYVVDACDTVSTKILIIEECLKRNIKVLSSMGMGKKTNLSKLKIMDIRKTSYDKLAKVVRKKLRDDGINEKVMVLSSDEEPIDTKDNIGSYSPLTSSAGLLMADYVIKDIIK
ncbi:MAG: ThiF family adenylyltransferase [Clostridia bacterium]|nr:ThiF family adenylyltransferase [Bacilli bacterium]MBR3153028.1 ThiF family adenylyltransferase [Clostridia bacterium]